jgi:hypothetical protein
MYNTIIAIYKAVLLSVCGYLVVALFVPSMSFWNTFGDIVGFIFTDMANIIYGLFANMGEHFQAIYSADQSATWAKITYKFMGILGVAAVGFYYIVLLFIFLMSVQRDGDKPDSAFAKNELYWIMGQTTSKELIEADVQANAIVNAMETRNNP